MSKLHVTPLEERALPAAIFLVAPVPPPIMFVVGTPPAVPQNVNVPNTPIVRLDVTASGAASEAPTQDVSDMATKTPPETSVPAQPTAEELALLEAELMVMQEAQISI